VISWRAIVAVAKKEYLDSVRNKWIIAVTAIYLVLTLAFSYFGAASSGQGVGFQGFNRTVVFMGSTAGLLVPILSLMVGYASIAGEREQGSLGLLLSMPLTRLELVLGKYAGLALVVATAIVAGLGIAGLVIASTAGAELWDAYLGLMGATVLLGLAFLAMSLFFSSLVQKRSSALGLAVFLWFFFTIIWNIILIGVVVATGGNLRIPPGGGGGSLELPGWYWGAQLFNPGQAYSLYMQRAFASAQTFGFGFGAIPDYASAGAAAASLLLWAVIPIVLAYLRLRRSDI